jgi:hypothetical protein
LKKPKQKYRHEFWERLPFKGYLIFLLSVFFSFSIFGFADDLLEKLSNPVPLILIFAIYSGCVAAGFAYSFTRNIKALPFVIVFQFGFMFVHWHDILPSSISVNQTSKLIFDAIGIYLAVASGYVFFIIFVTREGIKQIKLRTEMDLAAEMHEVLVPSIQMKNEKFEVYGKSIPASELGGD